MPRAAAILPTDPAFSHGTRSGVARGCKDETACPGHPETSVTCREARNAYQRDYYAKSKETSSGEGSAPAADQPGEKHARETGATGPSRDGGEQDPSTTGSQPEPSLSEHTAPSSLETVRTKPVPGPPRRPGQISAKGASRRLQALVYQGYSPVALAKRTQISVDGIWWLLMDPPHSIPDVTNRIITREFLALREQPRLADDKHELGREAAMARALADNYDFAGPFAWEDIDVDDDPIKRGRKGVLEPTAPAKQARKDEKLVEELRAEIETLRGNILEADQIAEQLRTDNTELTERLAIANENVEHALRTSAAAPEPAADIAPVASTEQRTGSLPLPFDDPELAITIDPTEANGIRLVFTMPPTGESLQIHVALTASDHLGLGDVAISVGSN